MYLFPINTILAWIIKIYHEREIWWIIIFYYCLLGISPTWTPRGLRSTSPYGPPTGDPSKGVDIASSSFPSIKNRGLIETVGLWNQQRGEWWWSMALMLEICLRGNNKDYYLSYFPFMINVYYPCYNCINRKQIHVWNINDKVSLVCLS